MKTKILVAAMALAGLMTVGSAVQAQSINVAVNGKVLPAACIPVISGGGVYDYGSIAASTLSLTTFNVLKPITSTFTVTCAAATRVAIQVADNRSASVVAGAAAAVNAAFLEDRNFGLGTVSNANVGGLIISLQWGTLTLDGKDVLAMISSDSGKTWAFRAGVMSKSPVMSSWGLTAAAGPVAGKVFDGTLQIQAILNKGSALPLTGDVPIDGSATISLVYL